MKYFLKSSSFETFKQKMLTFLHETFNKLNKQLTRTYHNEGTLIAAHILYIWKVFSFISQNIHIVH